MQLAYLTTAAHRLHYRTTGDENCPPLLILHGFLGSCEDFAGVLPYLTQHFFCILPDLPGHGKTTQAIGADESYRFLETGRSLIHLLDHLKIDCTNLLGYSMGGRIALYLTVHYSHRIARTILESASPGLRTAKARRLRLEKDEAIARQLETVPLNIFLASWYKNALFESLQHYPEAMKTMLANRQHNRPKELAKALRGLGTGQQASLWNDLQHIRSPLMLMFGSKDRKFLAIAKEMAAEYEKSNRKQAVVQRFEECGHNIHLEIAQKSPIYYKNVISDFIKSS